MKYIVFANKTKRVVLPPSDNRYTDLTEYVTQCEVEEIPAKYDFLTVDNVKERTRVVQEAYTEEVIDCNEAGEEITTIVEIPAEMETYYTCDLIAKEYTAEQLEKQKQAKYERLVEQYIRQQYSISQELAILRQRDSKVEEFNAYNEYAEECKAKAYLEVYGVKK